MLYQIFISYRRDGGESLAALLHDRLTRMGYRVFYDVETLRSGDFNKALLTVIEECSDVLLVLPPGGLDRCINNENDWVRQEIAHALRCEKNVIPILMRNFEFPNNLPEDIEAVQRMNGISTNMEFFDSVVHNIATKLLQCKVDMNTQQEQEIITNLQEKADSGDAYAQNELAILYEKGSYNLEQKLDEALRLYRDAYRNGLLAAGYNLADIYDRCADDLTLIGDYKLDDISVDSFDSIENIKEHLHSIAIDYYGSLANRDYAPALCKLGNIKESQRELDAAFSFYRKAAEKNFIPAVNSLAWMYRNGIGTDQDVSKAEALYKQAADTGDPIAVYNFANIIQSREPERAMQLYKQVAYGEQAIPLAAFALAKMYEDIDHDMRNAIVCYELALQGGVAEAENALERCRNTLIVANPSRN